MDEIDYASRVAKGVQWLNENHEGWRDAIDTDTLDMGSDHTCIIGQIHGEFHDLYRPLTWMADHGFYLTGEEIAGGPEDDWSLNHADMYSLLKDAWLNVLCN